MAQLYLFRCPSCEKDIEISEKLAGMTQNCPFCEIENSYPGMREIRRLPVAENQSSDSLAKPAFNETGSWLFSGGLLVAVMAGLLGFGVLYYANSLVAESPANLQIEFGNQQLDQLPAGHLWEVWDQMTGNGLPDWSETTINRYNKQADYLKWLAFALFGVSALGLVSLVSSFLMTRK